MRRTPSATLPARSRVTAAAASVLVLAGLVSAAPPARADTFALGLIDASTVFNIDRVGLTGWINDLYTFTVDDGASIDFTGFVNSVFGRNTTGAANLDATLYSNDPSFVQNAVVSTQATDGSFFTFERTATVGPQVLGEGSYGFYVTGLLQAGGFAPAVPSGYRGQLRFDGLAAPVPEPGTWALMGLGLVGVALSARRKRHLNG